MTPVTEQPKRPQNRKQWEPEPLHAPTPAPRRHAPDRSDRSEQPGSKPGSRVVVIDIA